MDKGEASKFMILIYEGVCGIYLSSESEMASGRAKRMKVADVPKGVMLGDKGLLKEAPRSATVTAEVDVKALYLSKDNYARVVATFDQRKMYDNITFMKLIPELDQLPYERKETLAKTFIAVIKNKGEKVVKVGDAAQQMMILKKGRLKVMK